MKCLCVLFDGWAGRVEGNSFNKKKDFMKSLFDFFAKAVHALDFLWFSVFASVLNFCRWTECVFIKSEL